MSEWEHNVYASAQIQLDYNQTEKFTNVIVSYLTNVDWHGLMKLYALYVDAYRDTPSSINMAVCLMYVLYLCLSWVFLP